ncbi:hypothetical protein [Streptomyces sp. NPDC058989]|uniref:hypothetical protein n=1 Tax=Streptomyces sp. NPDC058989 TaxID=3346686 RepID=UPI003691B3B8
MSFPPPPPSNQPQPPNQPPHDTPGGFGPPAGGYGPPGAGGPSGPGGWQQQPPGPPGGGGNGKVIAAIIGAGAVALAAVITFVVIANDDDDDNNRARPASSSSPSATPSDSASPSPSESSGATDYGSTPTPTSSTIPFYLLKVGDCYDLPKDGRGNNDAASCDGPHDAEVVTTHRLGTGLTTESEIKDKASALCRNELERKAARQPAGTAEGTYVQYPSLKGYKFGIKSVSCSLMGNRSGTKKLTKPLS